MKIDSERFIDALHSVMYVELPEHSQWFYSIEKDRLKAILNEHQPYELYWGVWSKKVAKQLFEAGNPGKNYSSLIREMYELFVRDAMSIYNRREEKK